MVDLKKISIYKECLEVLKELLQECDEAEDVNLHVLTAVDDLLEVLDKEYRYLLEKVVQHTCRESRYHLK